MGRMKPLVLVTLTPLLLTVLVTQGDHSTGGYFSGGTLSFYFINSSSDTSHNYTVHITVITGWVLGHGPCGPGCNMSDVGSSTHDRRIQAIQHSGKQDMFGGWNVEMESYGSARIRFQTITDFVNQHIQGRIAAVSTSVQWEQEIAHFEIEIDPNAYYTDVALLGSQWRAFDLNMRGASHSFTSYNNIGGTFRLQTKIKPSIRNDTGMPNSSPFVLYQPIYRVLLNSITEIPLTALDRDNDLIQCRKGANVETEGIGEMKNLTVSEKCVVTITAMERDGFRDDSWGVVALAVEDVNREPITMDSHVFRSYDVTGLSSSLLDFMVWVVANMTVPEFVAPTPTSQHVFTVYAGSLLSIPLAARPSNSSLPTTKVTMFHLVSLPDHKIMASTPQPDPHRLADRVMTSSIEWRTSDSDTGDFIIQVVAFDSEGFDSQDRNYKIHVNSIILDHGQQTDDHPYFPFFPKPASISCLQGATCSFPIFARPGTPGHVITSIGVVAAKTDISNTDSGNVEFVRYQGLHVYRTDVRFTSDLVGKKNICFFAKDDHNLRIEQCLEVSLYPPNPCDEKPCGYGVCVQDTINYGYTCTCPPGKTGPSCDQWLDPCSSHPCLNSGTCKSIRPRSIYACICPKGFSGVHDCATNIDECASNPCMNGGICVDEVNGYHCHCVSGYTGSNCEQVLPGLYWSRKGLQDHVTLFACPGDNVTFDWQVIQHIGDEVPDMRWFYEGLSQEMMALVSHDHFVILPTFSGRLRRTGNAGLILSDVVTQDSGNYTVEIVGVDLSSQNVFRLQHTVTLHVQEPPRTLNNEVKAHQQAQAVYDSTREQWAIELLCGTFLSLGSPPLEIVWKTPSGKTLPSTCYQNGNFSLLLSLPVEDGVYRCLSKSGTNSTDPKGGGCHVPPASVTVDGTKATETLLGVEIQRCHQQLNTKCGSQASIITFYAKLRDDVTAQHKEHLRLDEVFLNKGQGYNASLGSFIVPLNGTYSFIASAVSLSTSGSHGSSAEISLLVDGSSTVYPGHIDNGSLPDVMVSSVAVVLRLKEGDEVQPVCWSSSCNFRAYLTYFSGSLVLADP